LLLSCELRRPLRVELRLALVSLRELFLEGILDARHGGMVGSEHPDPIILSLLHFTQLRRRPSVRHRGKHLRRSR